MRWAGGTRRSRACRRWGAVPPIGSRPAAATAAPSWSEREKERESVREGRFWAKKIKDETTTFIDFKLRICYSWHVNINQRAMPCGKKGSENVSDFWAPICKKERNLHQSSPSTHIIFQSDKFTPILPLDSKETIFTSTPPASPHVKWPYRQDRQIDI